MHKRDVHAVPSVRVGAFPFRFLGLVLLGAVTLACSSPSWAEEDGAAIWASSGCANCHGNLAAGGGDAAYPAGPNLRRTRLDHAQLVETIACGRPSTAMPLHLKGAYTEVSCYGLDVGEIPEGTTGKGFLSAEEIGTLVDFLEANVVGKPKITRQNCALFNGGNENAPECLQYR